MGLVAHDPGRSRLVTKNSPIRDHGATIIGGGGPYLGPPQTTPTPAGAVGADTSGMNGYTAGRPAAGARSLEPLWSGCLPVSGAAAPLRTDGVRMRDDMSKR